MVCPKGWHFREVMNADFDSSEKQTKWSLGMIDVDSAAQKLIDAKDEGEEALDQQFHQINDAVIDRAKSQIPPGSDLSDFTKAMRQSDDYLASLAQKVRAQGILINETLSRRMVSERLTEYRQTSPFEPNWKPRRNQS